MVNPGILFLIPPAAARTNTGRLESIVACGKNAVMFFNVFFMVSWMSGSALSRRSNSCIYVGNRSSDLSIWSVCKFGQLFGWLLRKRMVQSVDNTDCNRHHCIHNSLLRMLWGGAPKFENDALCKQCIGTCWVRNVMRNIFSCFQFTFLLLAIIALEMAFVIYGLHYHSNVEVAIRQQISNNIQRYADFKQAWSRIQAKVKSKRPVEEKKMYWTVFPL